MTQFTAPFKLSRLKVGVHVLQGVWYDVLDAEGWTVCRIQADRRPRESEKSYAERIDSQCRALLELLNR